MEFEKLKERIWRNRNLISGRSLRLLIYTGLVSVIVIFIFFLSNHYMETFENELKKEIKQFEEDIIAEKKVFLKKAVNQAIHVINSESSNPSKTNSGEEKRRIFKNKIRENLKILNIASNCYIWINRIENYKGGDYYAVREIVPNISKSEGSWLSTETEDIRGNMPYRTELEGLKKKGEIFYEYHLKKVDSEDIDRRLIYAKLYKPYNWVVATGVYLDRLDLLVAKETDKINSNLARMKKKSIILLSAFIFIFLTFLFFIERKLGNVINSYKEEIQNNRIKLNEICVKDSLTGLNSRQKLNEFLSYEVAKSKRYEKIFSIILLDFDHFSEINNSFGRSKGDTILKTAGSVLKKCIRSVDIVGRWDGEEFLIICPETDINGARNLAQKIRKNISNTNFPISNTVTASFGTATFYNRDNMQTLMNRADRALYKAKESGRNRVE